MTQTQEILKKISAVRARLERAQVVMREADTAAAALADDEASAAEKLKANVDAGGRQSGLIDAALRPVDEQETSALPPRLTARAMRLVHLGRDLVQTMRRLAEDAALKKPSPRARLHHETLAMLDTVLRTVQAFPGAPSTQLRLCEGLEAVLDVVHQRIKVLETACQQHRRTEARIDALAGLYRKMISGHALRARDWQDFADEVWKEARAGAALRLVHTAPDDPHRFTAAHCWSTAQVVARLLLHERDWQNQVQECIIAALMHDLGMALIPANILKQEEPWSDQERREMERHTFLGGQVLAKVFAGGGMIVEAAIDHHERLDGTGYPTGKKESQLSAFSRLLAVCDVYTARCCPRHYRPPQDTRAALTDTLLDADRGGLDKVQAEKLLRLSFYPVGSIVELEDGAVGMVTATHPGDDGLLNPAKPILLMLTESQGEPLPWPRLLDLLYHEQRSILRTLPEEGRLHVLGSTFPELV